jgi:hypothetical protein
MNITAPESARLSNATALHGPVTAVEFPKVTDPTKGIVTPSLMAEFYDTDTRQFKLDTSYMPGITEGALQAELIRVPALGKTRQESKHGVLFGQLLLRGPADSEHSVLVAVKPMDTDEEAAHEYAVSSYMADGNIANCSTFHPLGITRTRKGTPAIITQYEHSVRTMDGVFWSDLIHETLIVDKALGHAAMAMARLHAAGWVHGDAEVKNMAWDVFKPHDSSFFVDLEAARPVEGLGTEDQRTKKLQDLEVFIGTVYRLREQEDFPMPEELPEQIKQHFGLVYEGIRDNLNGTQDRIDVETINEIADSQRIA